MQAAQFFAKVYNVTGVTFKRVIDAAIILGVPRIVREIGKPAGDIQIELALPFDNFGFGTTVDIGNFVRVFAVNPANKSGLLVYQGFIEELDGSYSRGNNTISLRIFPIDALLGRSLWKDGSYVITYPADDVDTIFSDAIDDINSIYGTFFTKNLGNPGVTLNQTFTRSTHLAALTSAGNALADGWYWRIRASGQVDLGQFNDAVPTHHLVVGKTVDTLRVVKSALNVKNKVVVSWGGTPTDSEYTNAPSIAAYGQRMALVSDSGINDQPTSDVRGGNELARLKDIVTKTEIVVNSQYAIETILPGDTVRVENVSSNTSQMVTGVLRVLRTEYDGSTCNLHLGDVLDNFGNELGKLINANQ